MQTKMSHVFHKASFCHQFVAHEELSISETLPAPTALWSQIQTLPFVRYWVAPLGWLKSVYHSSVRYHALSDVFIWRHQTKIYGTLGSTPAIPSIGLLVSHLGGALSMPEWSWELLSWIRNVRECILIWVPGQIPGGATCLPKWPWQFQLSTPFFFTISTGLLGSVALCSYSCCILPRGSCTWVMGGSDSCVSSLHVSCFTFQWSERPWVNCRMSTVPTMTP